MKDIVHNKASEPTDWETLERRLRGVIRRTAARLVQARAQNDTHEKVHACLKIGGCLRGLFCAYAILHGYKRVKGKGPTLWRIGNNLYYKKEQNGN